MFVLASDSITSYSDPSISIFKRAIWVWPSSVRMLESCFTGTLKDWSSVSGLSSAVCEMWSGFSGGLNITSPSKSARPTSWRINRSGTDCLQTHAIDFLGGIEDVNRESKIINQCQVEREIVSNAKAINNGLLLQATFDDFPTTVRRSKPFGRTTHLYSGKELTPNPTLTRRFKRRNSPLTAWYMMIPQSIWSRS